MIEILVCILLIMGGYGLKRMLELERILTLLMQDRGEELLVTEVMYLYKLRDKKS